MSAELPAKLCSHLQPQGQSCRSVAVTGSSYCHHHRRSRPRTLRQQRCARAARRKQSPTYLGSLTTRAAVLHGLSRVARGLAACTLDYNLATALLFRLQRATYALDQRETLSFQWRCNANPAQPAALQSTELFRAALTDNQQPTIDNWKK